MSLFPAVTPTSRDQIQSRLMTLAALFLTFFAVILTLSPAVRLHTWNVAYRWNHWIGLVAWLLVFGILHRQVSRLLPDCDPYLLPVAALLSGWGLLTIWRLDDSFGLRQTIWLGVILIVLWAGLRLPNILALLRRYKYLWLTGGLLLTGLTFFIGTYPGGTGPRLWLSFLGSFYLQPSEPLKLLLIVYLAAYLADRLPLSFNFLQLLTPSLVLVGSATLILVAQKDLGTASLALLIFAVVVYLASGRRRVLLLSAVAVLASGIAGYFLFSVIRLRVDAWLNPWLDPSGRSYQIVQSLLSIASGGIIGAGPGLGSPSLVPVAHSDFIFSAVVEETGLFGGVALLLLLAIFLVRGFRIALHAPNNYQRYLAGGLTSYICTQSILIIGGNLRLVPLTGVTLPFVSYGGSSLVTAFISLLLLCLISDQGEEEPAPLPTAAPYLVLAAAVFAAFLAAALLTGWWGLVRAEGLLLRTDNPRRSINDLYVQRGALLDRDNRPIMITEGKSGDYTRVAKYPSLGSVIGYTQPLFGQAGLEASLDPYLRGLQGNPNSLVWINDLLYNQPPPGLNVRLSLSLDLQSKADELLKDQKGALVLLNAQSGEILVMASHPNFDPNLLSTQGQQLILDPNAPLVNRAAQGKYPPGTAIGAFLLASFNQQLPELPTTLSAPVAGSNWDCAQMPPAPLTWAGVIANGCPAALLHLTKQFTPNQLINVYDQFGLLEQPDVPLALPAASSLTEFKNPDLAAIGQDSVEVSPLQMALAAAALSNAGVRPTPRLAVAVQTPNQGWVVLASESAHPAVFTNGIPNTIQLLQQAVPPSWQMLGSARDSQNQPLTWFLAGTLPDWQGTPLALALVLESNQPDLASKIGIELLQSAQQP